MPRRQFFFGRITWPECTCDLAGLRGRAVSALNGVSRSRSDEKEV